MLAFQLSISTIRTLRHHRISHGMSISKFLLKVLWFVDNFSHFSDMYRIKYSILIHVCTQWQYKYNESNDECCIVGCWNNNYYHHLEKSFSGSRSSFSSSSLNCSLANKMCLHHRCCDCSALTLSSEHDRATRVRTSGTAVAQMLRDAS